MATYYQTQQGSAMVYNSMESSQQGSAMVLNSLEAAQRGAHLIYNSMESSQQGSAMLYNTMYAQQQGYHYIYNTVTPDMIGRHRIANDALEGYVVYVGAGALPNLTGDPDGFETDLPVTVSVTPPGSGTQVLYVITRARNKYGLESQNQQVQTITIDTAGDEVLGSLTAPSILDIISVEDEYFRIFLSYPGYTSDTDPADTWRLYIKADAPPVPGVDSPVETADINGITTAATVGPYAAGNKTYYFVATVYRTEDTKESASASDSITLDADPTTPSPVPTGWVAD